jgi:hypothetical protein
MSNALGDIMRYERTFTDEDFLKSLSKTSFRTAGFIATQVGCTLPTAKSYLNSLAERKLITKIPVDEGKTFVYTLKD